jgi:hypothetical protein
VSEVLGAPLLQLLQLWRAWDARRLRESGKARLGRYDHHKGGQAAGVIPEGAGQTRPEARELRTLELAAWVADRSEFSFQETYDNVTARIRRLVAQGPGERHGEAHRRSRVTREDHASALTTYYRDPVPGDVGAMFYRARVDGAPLALSILVRPEWLDAAVELDSDQEQFRLAASIPRFPIDSLEGAPLTAALDRLAEVEVSGTVAINSPIYRLLDVVIARHCLKATVTLADFASYALTMDLLETELVNVLVRTSLRMSGITDMPSELPDLPLRTTYLPRVTSALALDERLCAGGPLALLAAARAPRRGQGDRDFALLVQERSSRVLNVAGRLAVVPKAFHGPTVEPTDEARLSASLERELEEELLGRQDLEQLAEGTGRRADPFHPEHVSEPMRWLLERRHTDAYRVECVGFGINMLTGNYEFPCLIVIDDEEWWARYSGQVEANWEAARIGATPPATRPACRPWPPIRGGATRGCSPSCRGCGGSPNSIRCRGLLYRGSTWGRDGGQLARRQRGYRRRGPPGLAGRALPWRLDGVRASEAVEIKWGIHPAGDDRGDWQADEQRTTVVLLVKGRFRLELTVGTFVLEKEGDYAIWGPGIDHSWHAEEDSVVITIRWPSMPQ